MLINIRTTGAIVSLVIPVSMQVGHRGVLKWGGVLAQGRLPYSKVILIHIYHVKCEAISNLECKQMQSNKKALISCRYGWEATVAPHACIVNSEYNQASLKLTENLITITTHGGATVTSPYLAANS